MHGSTTQAPWHNLFDESDDIDDFTEMDLSFSEELAAHSVYCLLGVVSSLCVLITVIRTKSVRSQLLGVMLVNQAIAVLILAMFDTKHIEMYARGIANFGIVGCHLYKLGKAVAHCVMNFSFIIICFDSVFSLPQSRMSRMAGTFFIWLLAIILPAIELYGIAKGLEVFPDPVIGSICIVRVPSMLLLISDLLLYNIIPSAFILHTLIRFCRVHRGNRFIKGKKLPFVLTTVMYVVLSWTAVISHVFSHKLLELYFWSTVMNAYGRVVIALIWMLLTPELRNIFLCRRTAVEDSIELIDDLHNGFD